MEGLAIPVGIDRGGVANFAQSNSYVEFFTGKEVDSAASTEAGRPIYKNADFVKVLHPGERDCAVVLASEVHKRKWPTQWAAYQNGREQVPEGTPIDTLFPNDPALVENLRSLKFFTVEQLAGASDSALQSISMGARDMQAKAKKYVDSAKASAGFHKLEGELQEKETRIRQLSDIVNKLQSRLSALEKRKGE